MKYGTSRQLNLPTATTRLAGPRARTASCTGATMRVLLKQDLARSRVPTDEISARPRMLGDSELEARGRDEDDFLAYSAFDEASSSVYAAYGSRQGGELERIDTRSKQVYTSLCASK